MMTANVDSSNNSLLYNNFSRSSNYSSNSEYLKSAYGNRVELQYSDKNYHDRVEIKNKKIGKKLIYGSAVILLATSVIAALGFGGKLDVAKMREYIDDAAKQFNPKSLGEKFKNSAANFTSLKDDYWDRFSNFCHDNKYTKFTPLRFLKPIGDQVTKFYMLIQNKFGAGKLSKYQKLIAESLQADGLNPDSIKLEKFDTQKVFEEMRQKFQNNRITKGFLTKEGAKKFANVPLRDITIAHVYDKNINLIEKIPQGASQKTKDLIHQYNSYQDNLLRKIGDIACGSAPTDVITAGIPLLGFGIGLAKTKNKDEKNKYIIDVGGPLIPTFSMPFVGLFIPALNGVKGMVAGFAVGQVFSQGFKFFNKHAIKNSDQNQNKNTHI